MTMASWSRPFHESGEAFEVVALAASAGGVKALQRLIAELPAAFPAPLLVVQHRSGDFPDRLHEVLGYRARLPVVRAEAGERPRAGTVHVAPAGRHLVMQPDGTFCTHHSRRVRFVRPSADLLFGSVAAHYGDRAIAVVLTGMGEDGARGVRAVGERGGFVIAQDETSAEYSEMPEAAIRTARVDLVLPLCRIAFALTALVMGAQAAVVLHPEVGPVGRGLRAVGRGTGGEPTRSRGAWIRSAGA
jgi:two-component system chemotaxis response regulator CheB